MKEPLRSRRMNQIIREKKDSINAMLSDEKRKLSTSIQEGGQR